MGGEYGGVLMDSSARGSINSPCSEIMERISDFGGKSKLLVWRKEGTDGQKEINVKREKNAKGSSRRKIFTESLTGLKNFYNF